MRISIPNLCKDIIAHADSVEILNNGLTIKVIPYSNKGMLTIFSKDNIELERKIFLYKTPPGKE